MLFAILLSLARRGFNSRISVRSLFFSLFSVIVVVVQCNLLKAPGGVIRTNNFGPYSKVGNKERNFPHPPLYLRTPFFDLHGLHPAYPGIISFLSYTRAALRSQCQLMLIPPDLQLSTPHLHPQTQQNNDSFHLIIQPLVMQLLSFFTTLATFKVAAALPSAVKGANDLVTGLIVPLHSVPKFAWTSTSVDIARPFPARRA